LGKKCQTEGRACGEYLKMNHRSTEDGGPAGRLQLAAGSDN
jgi:hypothetical protein